MMCLLYVLIAHEKIKGTSIERMSRLPPRRALVASFI